MQHGATTGTDEFPLEVGSGSVKVKVYRTIKKNGYASYAVPFYIDGVRKVRFFQDLETAKKEAKSVAGGISAGETIGVGLDAPTRLSYKRAEEMLAGVDIPVDTVVSRYVEARRALIEAGLSGDVVEAARDYAKRHRGIVANKPVGEAVRELLESVRTEQRNTTNGTRRKEAWAKLLKAHLGKVERDFSCNVTDLDSSNIEPWLIGLTCAERTRKNVRDCFAFFIQWCKGRNYLPKDAAPLANVQDFRKRKLGVVEVISAEALAKLLRHAPGDFVPYLALRAFAGLRDSEARALDWSHVALHEGWVDIPEAIAKQSDSEEGVARMVKVRKALSSWLKPYVKKSGPVCPYANTVKKLAEVAEEAKVELPRNALRHSFISAAVTLGQDLNAVSIEAGNSPTVIRQHYWRKMRPRQAKAWFAVLPSKAAENVVTLKQEAAA